jgi:hypothetical protein
MKTVIILFSGIHLLVHPRECRGNCMDPTRDGQPADIITPPCHPHGLKIKIEERDRICQILMITIESSFILFCAEHFRANDTNNLKCSACYLFHADFCLAYSSILKVEATFCSADCMALLLRRYTSSVLSG